MIAKSYMHSKHLLLRITNYGDYVSYYSGVSSLPSLRRFYDSIT